VDVDTVERCDFKNGQMGQYLQDFFDVKRVRAKDRHAQFGSKLSDFKKQPEVRQRLDGRRRSTHLENILPRLRSAATTVDKAVAAGDAIHDQDFAHLIADELRRVYSGLNRITPHEIKYSSGRKNSSIYDKG